MKPITRTALIFMVAAIAIAAAGCPERRSIADITSNPSRYRDKEVAIAGTVRDSYGINIPGTGIAGGAYKIDDGTGSIWVITKEAVPARGTEIGVKGVVGSGVSYNGRNYGLGLYEKDRRYKRR